MDSTQFDRLAKIVGVATSRRGALTVLGGLGLGSAGLAHSEETWAKSGKCKPKCDPQCETCKPGNCKKKNGEKTCKPGKCKRQPNGTTCGTGGTCQGGSCVVPICTGKDICVTPTNCQQSGTECFCFVTAGTGAPFCGQNSTAGTCADCAATGATCVDITLCGGTTRCSMPCPDPLV